MAKKKAKPKTASPPVKTPDVAPKATEEFVASIYSYPKVLPQAFVDKVNELEKAIGKEVWLTVHHGPNNPGAHSTSRIDAPLYRNLVAQKGRLPKMKRNAKGELESNLAYLLHSGGGSAEAAFRIARLFQLRCGGFDVLVPSWAKSAATLLSLGADKIILGEHAELGPLDVQIFDFDSEESFVSALDEVLAVEALEQSAIDSAWRMLVYLREQTNKKLNSLLPHALHFAAEVTKPLFEKVDAVRYSRQSRTLQEAQDYAERLLHKNHSVSESKAIARALVRNYSTHGFVIDYVEAKTIAKDEDGSPVSLPVQFPSKPVLELLDWFYRETGDITAIGRLEPKASGAVK